MDPFNSNLRKLEEAWGMLDEAMKDFDDNVGLLIPSTREFYLYQINNESAQVITDRREEGFAPHVLGGLNIRLGSSFNEIDSVAAEKGWGPLLYYTALVSTSPSFLAPTQDKSQVTDAAIKVWQKMPDNLIEKKPIENPVHDFEELNNSYKASNVLVRKYKDSIEKAKKRHESLISNYEDSEEANTFVWNACADYLDKKMGEIY